MNNDIVIWIIGGLLSMINVWFWNDKRKLDVELSKMEKKIDQIATDAHVLATKQQQFTTQSDVRDLIRESIEALHQSQRDTIILVREINTTLNQLSKDLAIINALRERDNVTKNPNS